MHIGPIIHSNIKSAEHIHSVFQASYPYEAKLIGVKQFPPLERSASAIQASKKLFLGAYSDNELIAVIEYFTQGKLLYIQSLVVHPNFFRRGIATKLMTYVLKSTSWTSAKVETACVNHPAISLYQKMGFSIREEYLAQYGICKVKLFRSLV